MSCPPQPLTGPSPRPAGERVAIPQSRESRVRGPTKAVIVRSYAGHEAGLSPRILELKSLAAMSIQRSVRRFDATLLLRPGPQKPSEHHQLPEVVSVVVNDKHGLAQYRLAIAVGNPGKQVSRTVFDQPLHGV